MTGVYTFIQILRLKKVFYPVKKLRSKFVSNDTFMEATCSRFRTSCCLHKGGRYVKSRL